MSAHVKLSATDSRDSLGTSRALLLTQNKHNTRDPTPRVPSTQPATTSLSLAAARSSARDKSQAFRFVGAFERLVLKASGAERGSLRKIICLGLAREPERERERHHQKQKRRKTERREGGEEGERGRETLGRSGQVRQVLL